MIPIDIAAHIQRPPVEGLGTTGIGLPAASIRKRGGCRIGMSFATWPFARLRADADSLSLGALIFDVTLRVAEVDRIEPTRGLLSAGIRIVSSKRADLPDPMIFWTGDARGLLALLARLGYPVIENT